MTAEAVARIVARYREGVPLRVLAEEHKVDKETIRRVLRRAGVPLRPRGGNQGPHSRHRI